MKQNRATFYSSEFYWSFFSSLIIALGVAIYQSSATLKAAQPNSSLDNSEKASLFTFSLLPFLGIYFIVGVIMIFYKKSESFAKGLLLSALFILGLMIFVFYRLTR